MLQFLPENLARDLAGRTDADGRRWIEALPRLVAQIERDWALQVGPPFPNLSYHFVAPCTLGAGGVAVIKIGVPGNNSSVAREKKILDAFAGRGVVRVLRFNAERAALLLERIVPGENLLALCQRDDAAANRAAIEVMRSYLRPPAKADDFTSLADWVGDLRRASTDEFAPSQVAKALDYFAGLSAVSSDARLLHGDLHHENILSASREPFLAIDPKGIVGDVGFELSTFLNNPRHWLSTHPRRREIQKGRLRQFSEAFGIEPEDLRRWAFVEAVLAAWWTFEGSRDDNQKWLASAEIWETYQV